MAKLVIVESPAKAKTIGKYLGDDYEVTASMGHIRDLPASQLGIDVEHGYAPQYISIKGKEKLIKELKSKAKHADGVLLATDPDREGEAISWHLANILGLDPHEPNRVTFDEITKKGVKEGMAHPRAIDEDLFNAQQARRVLDRLVGYKLSPFLWRKVRRGLSAGRVQSVAVRLIDDREKEIESFKPDEYWNVDVTLGAGHKSFTARLATDSKGKKLKKPAYKPIETKKGEMSEYAKWVESLPAPLPEVKYCDFNSIQQKRINTRSKLFYNFNPENDVFTMTLKYGVGTHRMPKLEYAVALMNNAGMLPDVEPLAIKRAMGELNVNCSYAVDDNYMYVMMNGYEKDLVKACQLLSKQILFPKLDDKQLQSLIGSAFGSRQMENSDISTLERALTSYVLYKDSSDYLQRIPTRDLLDLSITDLTTQFQAATNYECEIYYTGTAPFDEVYDVLSKNLPLKAEEMPSSSPELRTREKYAENTIFFLPNSKATQSKIYFFIEGKPFDVKDDIAIEAFSDYFGGGFGSLVMDEIREKRAMAYSAYGVISTPSVARRNFLFQGFVGTQGDKTLDAIDIYMNLLTDMPSMPEHFDVVKTNIKESILSAKPGFRSASAVYEAWKRMGYTQDPAIDKMKKIETLKFEDIVNFYNENIKGKPIVMAIVGNPKDFDVKALEKYGKVVKVSESKLFSESGF